MARPNPPGLVSPATGPSSGAGSRLYFRETGTLYEFMGPATGIPH
jgi:hypothetical protein